MDTNDRQLILKLMIEYSCAQVRVNVPMNLKPGDIGYLNDEYFSEMKSHLYDLFSDILTRE